MSTEDEEHDGIVSEWTWKPEPRRDAQDPEAMYGQGSAEVSADAAKNYMPILPASTQEESGAGEGVAAPKVYFMKPRPGTELEIYHRVPKQSQRRFWAYRHELYEQMSFILVRFGQTDLGRAWLLDEGWKFPAMRRPDGSPRFLSGLGKRYLSSKEMHAREERLIALPLDLQNAHYAWEEDLTRCALRLLGDGPEHLIRMSMFLLDKEPSPIESSVYRNAIGKASVFLPFLGEEEAQEFRDWVKEALRVYAT